MNNISEILKNINNNIYISGHKNADCDSICSSLALSLILKQLGKKAKVFLDKKTWDDIEYFQCENLITNKVVDKDYTFITLDLNRKERLPDELIDTYNKATYKINIDHHKKNIMEANYICSIEDISSTCEIIYDIAVFCKIKLNKQISELLYTGIISDTNMLTMNTTSKTHKTVSNLLKNNINQEFLIEKYVQSKTENELKLIAYMINNIQYNKFHYIILDMKSSLCQNIEYINISKKCIPIIMNNENIRVLIVIMNFGDKKKGEIRSKGNIDVEKLANLLTGGGHKNAAGFSNKKTINEIINISEKYITEILND